jgi:hypothetical protein
MSVFFHAFCEDCGDEVNVCRTCTKKPTYRMLDQCKDCDEQFCCSYAEEHHQDDPSVKALYLCTKCEEARSQASAEVFSYWRWPADSSKPLSPSNVYRAPRFRMVGEGTTDPVERADEARAAYDEEMKFSGNEEEALKIYVSFYNRGSPDPKKDRAMGLREGFVSMQEILAGRHVTGEQFFESLKYPDWEWEEDDSYVGNNPKTMSKQQLRRAMDEVDEDRKHFYRRVRGKDMTQDDEELILAMNQWALQLWGEMGNRRSVY